MLSLWGALLRYQQRNAFCLFLLVKNIICGGSPYYLWPQCKNFDVLDITRIYSNKRIYREPHIVYQQKGRWKVLIGFYFKNHRVCFGITQFRYLSITYVQASKYYYLYIL